MLLVCGASMLVGQVLETHLLPFWWKRLAMLEKSSAKKDYRRSFSAERKTSLEQASFDPSQIRDRFFAKAPLLATSLLPLL